jgi:hypothetical protein
MSQSLPIPDQVIGLTRQWWSDRNMHFVPTDFTSFIKKIQKNVGVKRQKDLKNALLPSLKGIYF